MAWVVLAVLCLVGVGFQVSTQGAEPVSPPRVLTTLTNAQQLIDLGMDGARQNPHPVRLRGVVTYHAVAFRNWIYVQDATGAQLVIYDSISEPPKAGQLVDVEGVAGVGAFHTFVRNAKVRVMGQAPMPVPKAAQPQALAAGAQFGHWVRIRCRIRNIFRMDEDIVILATTQNQTFTVWTTTLESTPYPPEWMDAEVDVDGIVWTTTDTANRAVGFRIHSPDAIHVHLVRPKTGGAFDTPLSTARNLRKLTRVQDSAARVRGVVTYVSPGGEAMVLRDDTGPVSVNLLGRLDRDSSIVASIAGKTNYVFAKEAPKSLPQVNDVVEVVGTPMGEAPFCTRLYGSEFRIAGRGEAPRPLSITGSEGLLPRNDCELVSIKARFVDRTSAASGALVAHQLWLQSDDFIFEGRFVGAPNAQIPATPGALVEVTGLCSPIVGEMRQPRGLRIQIRSTSDIRVLEAATTTLNPLAWQILGGGAGLLTLVLVWVGMLRRQVAERTAALATANTQLHSEVEERRKAQVDLHRALATERELSELKSRFVSLVSHEFRTPLGIIMSAVELLRNYLDRLPQDKRQELLEDIHSSTLRMSGLMEQVLILGRVEAGKVAFKPAPADIAGLGARLVDEALSANNERCPVEFQADGDLSGAVADESLLRHIFSNLISNAVKYSPPGSPVFFRVHREGSEAVFVVRDQGIGIPEQDQGRLFEAFHRASNVGQVSGTGLGLLLVRRCVEIHQGRVTFESKVGTGTTFTVRLPLFRSVN